MGIILIYLLIGGLIAYPLLKALQDLHDYSSPHYWENELHYVAKKFDLK